MTNKRMVFFLGGHDAEMCSIGKLAARKGYTVIDGKLNWKTAKLSRYKKQISELSNEELPVFIELYIDDHQILKGMEEGKDYIIVDHHGEKAGRDKKTSLEQVFDLLVLNQSKMSRYHRLIIANDKGHVRAMRRECPSPADVRRIRELDLKCQKVEEKDNELADQSIKENLTVINPQTAVVQSLTQHTSLISDKLWDKYTHLFIRSTGENGQRIFNYSGTGQIVSKLKVRFAAEKAKNPNLYSWFGGEMPDFGYFGCNHDFSDDEIKEMVGMEPEMKYFSHHIFMFPFIIKDINKGNKEAENGNFLKNISSKIHGNNRWSNKLFDLENSDTSQSPIEEKYLEYSEFYYFYKFVRDSVFDCKSFKSDSSDDKCRKLTFFMKDFKEGKYIIRLRGKIPEKYELIISSIHLHIFETNVGILSFDIENWNHPNISDILRINDYGRRFYPQYMGSRGSCDTKTQFLAESIEVIIDGESYKEDFQSSDFLYNELHIGSHIMKTLGDTFTIDESKEKYRIEPVIDDRMYTVCWYRNTSLSDYMKCPIDNGHRYEIDDTWYQYVFVDHDGPTVANKFMQRELAKQATYSRWVDWGTLYGISRYSLVCLVNTKDNEFDFGYEIIRQHMRRMYYQMAVILLMQRASILAFSGRVSDISGRIRENFKSKADNEKKNKADNEKKNKSDNKKKNNDSMEKVLEDIRDLDGDMIHFVNRLWFSEITPQEQGIEMYEQTQKVMNLKEQMRDLKSEIQELYDYARLQEDKTNNQMMMQLTILGAVFLPLTLVTGIWGMNVLPADFYGVYPSLLVIISTLLMILITVFLTWKKKWPLNKSYFKLIVGLSGAGIAFSAFSCLLSNRLGWLEKLTHSIYRLFQ